MSTEKKDDQKHQATTTDERYATGTHARDGQTSAQPGRLQELSKNWDSTCSELQSKYSQLTPQDCEMKPGKEQETIDRIGKKLNKTPEEAAKLVHECATASSQHPNQQTRSSSATAGTATPGTHTSHKDMPEARERKERRDEPQAETKNKPQA